MARADALHVSGSTGILVRILDIYLVLLTSNLQLSVAMKQQ